jgi:hypothetical protein
MRTKLLVILLAAVGLFHHSCTDQDNTVVENDFSRGGKAGIFLRYDLRYSLY